MRIILFTPVAIWYPLCCVPGTERFFVWAIPFSVDLTTSMARIHGSTLCFCFVGVANLCTLFIHHTGFKTPDHHWGTKATQHDVSKTPRPHTAHGSRGSNTSNDRPCGHGGWGKASPVVAGARGVMRCVFHCRCCDHLDATRESNSWFLSSILFPRVFPGCLRGAGVRC